MEINFFFFWGGGGGGWRNNGITISFGTAITQGRGGFLGVLYRGAF